MTSNVYQYRVTLRAHDGTKTEWRVHGREGLIEATQSVDWDVKNRHAASGTVTRLNSSGGDDKEIYRRTA